MIDHDRYDGVIAALYATVTEPGAWDTALASLRSAFDANVVSLNTRHRGVTRSMSTAQALSDYFVEHWVGANPYDLPGTKVGDVGLGSDLADQAMLLASAYYNEFLLPADIPQLMGIRAAGWTDGFATVNILRGRRQPELGEAEVELARRLAVHIVNALGTTAMLGWKSWTTLTASLEAERDAMVLVDRAGLVLHMNRAARVLTDAREGIAVGKHGLEAVIGDRKRLRQAIWQAAGAPAPRTGTMLAIERPAYGRPLIASITPLGDDLPDVGIPRPRALIAILDRAPAASAPAADLQRLFGLTLREADVAQALAEGLTISGAADRCGVTLVTARNYLARVLRKTQLNRQGELVLFLNGIARLKSRAE